MFTFYCTQPDISRTMTMLNRHQNSISPGKFVVIKKLLILVYYYNIIGVWGG